MTDYVIALEPEMRLKKRILQLKRKAKAIAGSQKYLADAPHCTLMVFNVKDKAVLMRELAVVRDEIIAPALGDIHPEISNWLVFSGDVITGNETLVCGLGRTCEKKLAVMQQKAVARISKLRRPQLPERYVKASRMLPKGMRDDLQKYGYPFVGKGWKPHLSIASFEKASFATVYTALEKSCPKGKFRFDALVLYRLSGKEKLAVLKRYPLKQKTCGGRR